MKTAKIISFILALLIVASCFAMGVSADGPKNLALDATPFAATAHNDETWNWSLSNINDGDVFEIGPDHNNNGGTASGYHTQPFVEETSEQYVGFDFGKAVDFNTMIVYPVNTNTMPIDFDIQVSNDKEEWTTVLSKTGYSIDVSHTSENAHGCLPQTFTFSTQNKQYVRLFTRKLNNDGAMFAMKLTEIEVFNVTETVEEPENLAKWKPIESDSAHSDDNSKTWRLENLNDGDRINLCTHYLDYGQFLGYHTSPATPRDGGENAHAQVTIELGEGTKFNQVVIYPSNEIHSIKNPNDDPNNPQGIYFPENFIIQISDDGETWTDVVTKTEYTATADPQVFDFSTVTAKYVRLQMNNLTHYVKLTEFEVYNIENDEPVSEEEFEITSGKSSKIYAGSKVTVKANAPITSVQAQDETIDLQESDYTISGNTVTFNKSFTSRLDPGTYTFIINSEDGEAEITITVRERPETGDAEIIAIAALAVVSLAGAALVTAKRKKIKG